MQAENIVEISKLRFGYADRELLKGISLTIPRGKVVGIMGASGCGKSTLLRLIGGQLVPADGYVKVDGQVVHELSRVALYQLRRKMGMQFQMGGLFTDLSVFENIAFQMREHTDLPESMIRDLVLMKLAAVGLRGAARLMPAELSGGMARRVGLARAIALDPMLIMYDEPFSGLDPISCNVIGNLIRQGTSQRYLQQQESIEDDRKLNLFQIIKHLGDKWRESSQGFLSSHIREVLGLPPEIIRVALIPFELLIGVATFTPPATGVRLNKDYDFELTALTAAFQNPGDNPGNMQRVTFNMRESGRNFDVFDTGPINLGNVTSTVGPGSIIEFPRGLYKFRAGSTITPDFRRAPNGGAFVGEDRTVNVLLIGNLIRSK